MRGPIPTPARAILLTAILLVAGACASFRDETCPQCGRAECKNLGFEVTLAGGTIVRTCCPRCGLRALEEGGGRAERLRVKDFDTARWIDARAAVYVEASDVHPCSTMHGEPPTDERGCCLKAVYDRCEPSLIAFAERPRAERFAREHGGFVREFDRVESASD
jgi:hypothetical protein